RAEQPPGVGGGREPPRPGQQNQSFDSRTYAGPELRQQFFGLLLRFFSEFFGLFLRFFEVLLALALAVFKLFLGFFDPAFGRFDAGFGFLLGVVGLGRDFFGDRAAAGAAAATAATADQ